MKYSFNKDKILTIGILPVMWLIYFLFEVFSGRVNDLYTLVLNLCLTLVFALTGWIIYKCNTKNPNGLNTKILLTQKFNREPSINEVAMFLEMDIGLINDVIITCMSVLSLDNESEVLNDSNLYATIGKDLDYDTNILVRDSLEYLNEDEKKVTYYRYYYDYTQQEIADMMGINQVKVSRLESSSKKKIKEYICA